jgi:hypothetical protein
MNNPRPQKHLQIILDPVEQPAPEEPHVDPGSKKDVMLNQGTKLMEAASDQERLFKAGTFLTG